MNKVELLAPSGNFECVRAAVASGANAVYLGGQLFSARAYAGNFSVEELNEVCDYCHCRGVKVYVTVNTLYKDSEFEQLKVFIGELYRMGVDGLIMQDLGAIRLVRTCYPDLPVHASTQLTANSLDEVRAFEKLGITTVVLSRELSLEEIRNICRNTSLRVEVFIHGALCVSYSGQCYISSVLGNRSGNRGKCAQNCRMEYDMYQDDRKVAKGHLLSTKDICTVNDLARLLDAGVASLKIEGRMKSPEYVATVTGVYRKYIDEYYKGNKMKLSRDDLLKLQFSFNRGGFSEGYLNSRSGPDMMCPIHPRNWGVYAGKVVSYDASRELVQISFNRDLIPGDGVEIWSDDPNGTGFYVNKAVQRSETVSFKVKGKIRKNQPVYQTFSKLLNDTVDRDYRNANRQIEVTGKAIILENREASLALKYGNISVSCTGDIPQPSQNQPLTEELVSKQISRTGNTNVTISNLDVVLDEGLYLNKSQLNTLKNEAIAALNRKIISSSKRDKAAEQLPEFEKKYVDNGYKLSVLVSNMSQLKEVLKDGSVDTVYLPVTQFDGITEAVDMIHERGCQRVIKVPRLWRAHTQKTYDEVLSEIGNLPVDGYLIHNIGQLYRFIRTGQPLYLDYTGNIINSHSLRFWNDLERVTLSPEISVEEIEGLSDNSRCELLVYGRLPLMITEQCPVGNFVGNKKKLFCSKKGSKEKYYLENNGNRFLLDRDCNDCVCSIMTDKPLKRFSMVTSVSLPHYRLDFSDESAKEVRELLNELKKAADNGSGDDNSLAQIYYRSIA